MAVWVARKADRRCKFKRRSKAISIVAEEIYLRDDIPCGSPLCSSCASHLPRLPPDASHYLLPNADAVLQFWEILELPQFSAVIFLTSVLKEVQENLGQRSWRRLRSIFTDHRRCNIVFDDQHCIYTCLSRCETASSNYLKEVTVWFANHINGGVPVVLLTGLTSTDSGRNLTDSRTTVEVLEAGTYFSKYWNHDSSVADLFTSLSATIIEAVEVKAKLSDGRMPPSGGGKGLYKEHLSTISLEAGISRGDLRVGVFFVNRHAPSEALVRPSNKGEASRLEIVVAGRVLQNRAIHGDTVVVKTCKLRLTENENEDILNEDVLDDEEGSRHLSDDALISGEVVGILQRNQRDYVACLLEEDEAFLTASRQERLLCVPMDKRIPLVEVSTRQGLRLSNQRFILRIDNWELDSRFPRGHVVRSLGPIGDLNAELNAILVENGISVAPFSNLSLQELPEDSLDNPWSIPEEEFAVRRDIRFSHRSCSIDPPGSKDVDDVLSVSDLENGMVEIGVHIADVSYFVKQGSLLDLEARSRGTTVYMVGKSWHMLPSVLSENLCSLVGGKDRLAVSVIWTLDRQNNFEVVKTWFGRTIIRSRYQLFYAQAETIMEGKRLLPGWEIKSGSNDLSQLQSDLLLLGTFAQSRRLFRRLNGALELASTELKFEIDERREPVQVETKVELPMNWIVAEMMIYANACVGEKIYRAFPSCALLRKHSPPKIDSFTTLLECCEARGFVLDVSSNKQLAASLDRMRDSGDFVVERAFRALVTRAMSEAEYFSTGEDLEPSHFYHYGLALEFYTHFTSPIRRYADILAHRMLIAACQEQNLESGIVKVPHIMSSIELQEVAEHVNEKHRTSKRAQKECNELYLLMFLQKQAKAELAVVIGVTTKGIMVFVPKYDLRGLVLLEDKNGRVILPEMHSETSEKQYRLIKQKTSIKITDVTDGRCDREYKLMDTVWVRLRADGTSICFSGLLRFLSFMTGSRAHGPTLRMDLLSERHPLVLAAQTENLSSSISQLDLFKPDIKTSANLERNKAIQAMAALEKACRISADNAAPVHKRRKLAVVDVLQNAFQAKALPLFSINSAVEDQTFSAALGNSDLNSVTVSLASDKETGALAVNDETQMQLSLRRRWQERLAQAGFTKARLTTSTSSNESPRQVARANREAQFRAYGQSIGSTVY
ncbi:DIS3-like exonuclease 1 isoform X1 [Selaginella moellendorffii]|uniref:DIS3-like exonuclease 1 isoform X1 n=1 Tax=Selaginella moellendorffii TaxID=88036 RepID=UPI000D1CD75D|nr:DIS3-like exonuclease 1 isoform X1 [Selaginella moellendorffii]XP_024544595.1 DIS3-like exonuclease 1 isoform X1 [Selaginella moellendorffii]|eukprot:XP_024544594.1 DIS3-like exonuclease 1 isoform X1 [Selaginella moellendorffii]